MFGFKRKVRWKYVTYPFTSLKAATVSQSGELHLEKEKNNNVNHPLLKRMNAVALFRARSGLKSSSARERVQYSALKGMIDVSA